MKDKLLVNEVKHTSMQKTLTSKLTCSLSLDVDARLIVKASPTQNVLFAIVVIEQELLVVLLADKLG